MISQLYSATVSNVTELESIRVLCVCWWVTSSFIVVEFKHFVDHYGLLDTDSAFTARTRRPQYFFTLGGRSTVEFHLVTHFVQRRVATVWMHCTWAANLHQVLNETKKYDLRSFFYFEYCQRNVFWVFLTVIWERMASSDIHSPNCLMGTCMCSGQISVTITSD